MAFCPNCGKPVTEQASKCLACGQEFEPRAKAARFKGTMMMTPATAPQPTGAAPATPAVQQAAPKPQPAPAAPAPQTTTPGPSKVAKATMLGTGGLGLVPPSAAVGARTGPAPQPPPAAGAAPAASGTAPALGAQPPAAPHGEAPRRSAGAVPASDASPPTPAPPVRDAALADSPSGPREDSQRFLVGDPMAPSPAAQRSARRAGRGGESGVPIQRTSLMLIVGVLGILVIAAVGYAAARFMGLIQ